MVLIIIIVCLLLFINWLINSNVRSVKESNAGTVVRILISHLQLTGLCAHFALNWPTPVTIFFNLASIVSNVGASQILLLDCLLGTYEDVFPHVFKRTVTWAFAPVVLILAYTILWSRKADVDGDGTADQLGLRDRFLISFFVVNFMLYPTLCKEGMMVFSCVSIGDGDHWFMNGDFDVECYVDARYNRFSLIIMLPMVILYILGVPLATAMIIYSHRNYLHKPANVVKLHMLTAGIRDSRLMWEVMMLLQKTAFVWVAVYMRKYGQVSQAYAGIMVLMVGLLSLLKDHPYKVINTGYDPDSGKFDNKKKGDILQTLASQSYIVLLTTMFLGIFEMIASEYFYEEVQTSVENFSMGMLCIILMTNIVYVVQAMRIYILELHRENQLGKTGGRVMYKLRQLSGLSKSQKSVSKFKRASLRVTSIFDGDKLWNEKKSASGGEENEQALLAIASVKTEKTEESAKFLAKVKKEKEMDEAAYKAQKKAKVKARFKKAMLLNKMAMQYNDSKESIDQARTSLTLAIRNKDLNLLRSLIRALNTHSKMVNALAAEISKAAICVEDTQNEIIAELIAASKDHSNPDQAERLRKAFDRAMDNGVQEPKELITESEKLLKTAEHLKKLEKMIEQLNSRTIAEIKSFKKPPEDVVKVMKAVMLAVGTPPKEVSDWGGIKLWLGKTGKMSIKRRIQTLDYAVLKSKKRTVKVIEKLIASVHIDKVESISKGASVFYAWTSGVLMDIDEDFGK
jgi:hypothetical protein